MVRTIRLWVRGFRHHPRPNSAVSKKFDPTGPLSTDPPGSEVFEFMGKSVGSSRGCFLAVATCHVAVAPQKGAAAAKIEAESVYRPAVRFLTPTLVMEVFGGPVYGTPKPTIC